MVKVMIVWRGADQKKKNDLQKNDKHGQCCTRDLGRDLTAISNMRNATFGAKQIKSKTHLGQQKQDRRVPTEAFRLVWAPALIVNSNN